MQIERLVVKYVTVPNCFVYLRDTWLRKLETKENVVEILHKNKTYYASCIAGAYPSGTLCIGSTFARTLNIEEGDEVFVSLVKDVPQLVKITVVPHSENDREILVRPKNFNTLSAMPVPEDRYHTLHLSNIGPSGLTNGFSFVLAPIHENQQLYI